MNQTGKYTPFFASALLMWVALYIIYPHYQYYIDPDGTAYLTISQRYADGDFKTAVNGYWSPWSCWLTALLIKCGLQAIPASVIINTLGATGFLFISQSFFTKFSLSSFMQWLFNIALAIFLCYAIFAQSFDDLWECFFLLAALRIMLADGFIQKPVLWAGIGIIGALAYFAKAYSFPFFIVNTVCCTYLLSNNDKGVWMKICAASILTMLVCTSPWIYLLHEKYDTWTTSTAGSLNMSWYLVDHPYWKEGIDILVPPVHPGSPYYWEDPYLVNGITPHFWDSWDLFMKQTGKLGLNLYKFALSIAQLSVLFPFVLFYAAGTLVSKKDTDKGTTNFKVICLSLLLFPLGYLSINFESRYLWYMLPLAIPINFHFMSVKFKQEKVRIWSVVFFMTIIIYPAIKLVRMYNQGKQEYEFAMRLKEAHIKGTIVSNMHPRSLSKIAYFSGNSFYFVAKQTPDTNGNLAANTAALLGEIGKYHIDYYIHSPQESPFGESTNFHEIFIDKPVDKPVILREKGITVYKLH